MEFAVENERSFTEAFLKKIKSVLLFVALIAVFVMCSSTVHAATYDCSTSAGKTALKNGIVNTIKSSSQTQVITLSTKGGLSYHEALSVVQTAEKEMMPYQATWGMNSYNTSITPATSTGNGIQIMSTGNNPKIRLNIGCAQTQISGSNSNKGLIASWNSAAGVKAAQSDLTKVKKIRDHLVNRISYKYDKSNSSLWNWKYAYNNRKGNCVAFGNIFRMMAKNAGLNARVVWGTCNGGSHIWNRVKINGAWNYIDVDAMREGMELNRSDLKKCGTPTTSLWGSHKIYTK